MRTSKIGLPQALSYHYYHPMWHAYFEALGLQVKTSGPTNRHKLDEGIKIAPSEACLPLKSYFGHLLSLVGKVDHIFVPRLVCLRKQPGIRLGCPKLIGLPDMVNALVPHAKIITTNIDLRTKCESESYLELAIKLGFSKDAAQRAYECALDKLAQFKKEAANKLRANPDEDRKMRIGLLGHAYLLNDNYLNLNLTKKILDSGAQTINCHDLPENDIEQELQHINPVSWFFEERILCAAQLFHHTRKLSGIIYLLSFGCGAGSITHEVIDFEIRKAPTIPMLRIVLDEHTGETGVLTRLESFVDMIKLRKEQIF
jgi:predicted nucleotide-binding protein (sugar kinase/HSP70/actin superfamily)